MSIPSLPHYVNGERVAAKAEATSENPSDTRDIVAHFGTRRSSYRAREQGFAAVEFYTQVKTAYVWG